MKVIRRGNVVLHDYEPKQDFAADVAAGLVQDPPCIPSKYLYDAQGSRLFERICELPEYYLTRTELSILEAHIGEMAVLLGPRCAVVEPGAGSGVKTRLLLSRLEDPVAYVPVDISRALLIETANALAADFPNVKIRPVCADYLGDWELPPLRRHASRNVVFFPGSTTGNMEPAEAADLLRKLRSVCGPGCGMLVGIDLQKDPAVISAAYDDAEGVTRQFNLNLVQRMNRELGTALDPAGFAHYTAYNASAGRNESYLQVVDDQRFDIHGHVFDFPAGTLILVEHSYKYSLEGFAELAARAGLRVEQVWTDARQWFSVQYLVAA